jgi:hypothetical protein
LDDKKRFGQIGYNNIALNIGVEKLIRSGMLTAKRVKDYSDEFYNEYYVEDAGLQWLIDNSDRLELSSRKPDTKSSSRTPDLDDEIPF